MTLDWKICRVSAAAAGRTGFFCRAVCALLLLEGGAAPAQENQGPNLPAAATLTNILQFRRLAAGPESRCCSVRFEGTVLWASAAQNLLILQDDSAGLAVKMNLSNQPPMLAGQRILLEGGCVANRGRMVDQPLVDNDGLHSKLEKAQSTFLTAGLHPVSVEWFNGPAEYELDLDWAGPDRPRERIPEASLFRPGTDERAGAIEPGLAYRAYEGQWKQLPKFLDLPVFKQGVISNFDLQIRPRNTNVGVVFSGYLAVPKEGTYTFWLKSDDGSRLYLDNGPLRISVLGQGKPPTPRVIIPGQMIPEEYDCQWVESEGVITGVSEGSGGASLELSTGMGHAHVELGTGSRESLGLLLHSRIKARGICQNAADIDGQKVPTLRVQDLKDVTVEEIATEQWLDHPLLSIGSLEETNSPKLSDALVHVSGIVRSNAQGNCLTLEDKTGRIMMDTTQAPPQIGELIEALGWYGSGGQNGRLEVGFYRKMPAPATNGAESLPLLTQAIQVKSLSRAEAQRGYPVKMQGVITAHGTRDFVIQDSTASIYLNWINPEVREVPRIGEYWEIEGESCVEFAPNIRVSRASYIRPGIIPEPHRPTGEELINGSQDTKYIEIQGVATRIKEGEWTLLTREGTVKLRPRFSDPESNSFAGYEGALVRIRGSCVPARDENQRMLPLLELLNASVSVDAPAPADPFATPLKRASDLLFFDARADVLRRVRIAGQVLAERKGEYFLMDGQNGFRLKPRLPLKLEPGDEVEVVGFPNINGPSPVLQEAQAKRIGKADLPAAAVLSENGMLNGKLDATLVRVQSRLVSLNAERNDQVLELQTGNRGYIARLQNRNGLLSGILPGSQLELTGVYSGQGGDRASSRDIDSFELLLNSPQDIRVLTRPSWWTIRHTVTVMGAMLFVLVAAVVWITLLRRQVEERSLQLTAEIKNREQAEHQRALEEERARIAQDLHDDLGATLTEIRFLSAVESCDSLVPQATRSQLRKVSEKSHQLVSSLDEIVWAVNPANDSLSSLANYLCHVAEEFFRTTPVRCRLDVDESLPAVALNSEVRHNLYLSIREALNNVAKHSQATEAWLRIHWQDQTLHITVEDNGCGFTDANGAAPNGNGLPNMRHRLEKIGGRFECDTRPGAGTVCRVCLSFN